MTIFTRRDIGYTIISRLEKSLRYVIQELTQSRGGVVHQLIPSGIIAKILSKDGNDNDIADFLEKSDFPDLKEILLFKDNISYVNPEMDRKHFYSQMDELYQLRCKIAHVKGDFTSLDLDKLIELTRKVSTSIILGDDELVLLLEMIESNPDTVVIKVPNTFTSDIFKESGVFNNLPTPDYTLEGGFVGREIDRKKIIQLLKTEKFPVVTITGAGGVGKTSLALRLIQDIMQDIKVKEFDAIIWLSAKENKLTAIGIEDIEPTLKNYEELLDVILSVFGFEAKEGDSITQKEENTQQLFNISHRVLIVIDNLETITDERIINFIIEAPQNVKFLITSRKGIGQIEIRHELKQLKESEAIYLFRQLARDKQVFGLQTLPDNIIKKYVEKVSYYPLAIKWVVGQVARGKDINRIVESIHDTESDINRFCFEQIFDALTINSQQILFALCCFDSPPTSAILQYVVSIDDVIFDDSIEELILTSLIIPEQYRNEKEEISRKFTLLSLTKGYVNARLAKDGSSRRELTARIIEVENTLTITEKAKREYRYSLHNLGAKTDEEKVASILAQAAFQKYQAGNYEDAVEDYRKAIRIAPTFYAIYRNWGVMESYEGHLLEADKLLEKAEELNSSDPQIYLSWGNILRKNGKNTDALKKYEKAYAIVPTDHIVLSAYGNAKSKVGEYEEADKLLRNALHSDHLKLTNKHNFITLCSISENYIFWMRSLLKNKQYQDVRQKGDLAIKALNEARGIDNNDPAVYAAMTEVNYILGKLSMSIGRTDEANKYYLKVFNSQTNSLRHQATVIKAGMALSSYYMSKNQEEEARSILVNLNSKVNLNAIFKQPWNAELQSRYSELKSVLTSTERIDGIIKYVDFDLKYVLVANTNNIDDVYIANHTSFIPALSNVSQDLCNRAVRFIPSTKIKSGKTKKSALFIKLG